jgi:uncharacterized protein YeaO (DUF488 family)
LPAAEKLTRRIFAESSPDFRDFSMLEESMIEIKRAYEPADKKDGYRIFIDRLWPRGLKKSEFQFDEWVKDITPSTGIRKAFGHKPENWKTFSAAYKKELKAKAIQPLLHEIADKSRKRKITLVYGAHDPKYNHAVILKDVLEKMAEA